MRGPFPALALAAALFAPAVPAGAQAIPEAARGSWDVSAAACDGPCTSMTRVDIDALAIRTFGGDAVVRAVERTGPVTYVAAGFLQTEGVAELGPRVPAYFRLTQREGQDRLAFIWKDVRTDALVRCGAAAAAAPGPMPRERPTAASLGCVAAGLRWARACRAKSRDSP